MINAKFRVTGPAQSEALQRELFARGCCWPKGSQTVKYRTAPFLVIRRGGITWVLEDDYFVRVELPELDPNEFIGGSNPKDAIGCDKLPLHLWPESATAYGCVGLANGMLKYGRNNWREAGVRASIYVDAARRHITDWFEGNDSDPEDGVHNLSAALACLAIIVDAMSTGKLNDDRNYNGVGWRTARAEMEPHIKRLKELHAGRDPKHYMIEQ